ncbi:hypothetical protein L873DRAFT_1841573 [Choiromyces venosus 120613-1]|uniref:Uncharacterized protein n=1 Tax=Choiromyces venosus 120613-1 TaxID=1336337 RepID=A0A3N4K0W9_9PEZI|nr:hypothetical protein L873DRAFT_1841573 [Choiromyces venosus 120613-1]
MKKKNSRSEGERRRRHTRSALGLFTDGIPRFDKFVQNTISTRIACVPKNAPSVAFQLVKSLPCPERPGDTSDALGGRCRKYIHDVEQACEDMVFANYASFSKHQIPFKDEIPEKWYPEMREQLSMQVMDGLMEFVGAMDSGGMDAD